MKKNRKGFTLIELLVVIAIIGLLSTLAVIALGSARVKARDTKRLADLRQVQTGLELYYTDKGAYPISATTTILGEDTNAKCLNGSGFGAVGCATPVYIGLIPKDPGTGDYGYVSVTGSTYVITGTLEGEVNDLTSGPILATPSGIRNQ